MCGIVGFVKLDKKNKTLIDYDNMASGFSEASKRGIGAAGFYSPDTGVVKDGIHPDFFIRKNKKEVLVALSSPMLIGHARAASRDPRVEAPYTDNNNNHPHESKNYVLIHNGYFQYLPKIKGYPYAGTCDSELAVSYIETFGVIPALKLMSKDDKFALVFVHKPTGRVYFYRNENPIVYSYDVPTGCLVFGSTTRTVLNLATVYDGFGLGLYGTLETCDITENQLFSVSPEGLFEVHQKIEHLPYARAIREAEEKFKKRLETTDFFEHLHRILGGGNKPSPQLPITTALVPRLPISQTPSYSVLSMRSVFTTIRDGVLIMNTPLRYVGDATN